MAQIALTSAGAAPTRTSVRRGLLESRGFLGLIFMLPAAAILLFFLTYPLGLGVWLGFTDTRLNRPGAFIGLENYESLLDDPIFLLSIFNTILYTAVASV
jgi:multiple sugar transport system permease protein